MINTSVAFLAKEIVGKKGGVSDVVIYVVRPGHDVGAVRHFGAAHVVGILVGHYGAGHVLRHVRHGDGYFRVFRGDQTGERRVVDNWGKILELIKLRSRLFRITFCQTCATDSI